MILISYWKEYLFQIKDLISELYTEEFFVKEILKILKKFNINKFCIIVTDNGSNIKITWNLISI